MIVEISANRIPVDWSLRAYIDRHLHRNLNVVRQYITRLTFRLTDINGPRGGICKRCHVVASTGGFGQIVVSETQSTIHESISCAVAKLRNSIQRRRGRRIKSRKRGQGLAEVHGGLNTAELIPAQRRRRPEECIIRESDRPKLGTLLDQARRRGTAARDVLDRLEAKLERGSWMPGPSLPSGVVVMNSKLTFQDFLTGEIEQLILVYPEAIVSVRDGVSVLSLLGSELLGHRAGDEIEVASAGFELWGRIEEVLY